MSLSFYTAGFYTTMEQRKPWQSLLYFIFGVDSMYLILFPNVTSLLTKKTKREDKDMCAFIQWQKNELKGLHGIRLL